MKTKLMNLHRFYPRHGSHKVCLFLDSSVIIENHIKLVPRTQPSNLRSIH